MGSNGKIIRVGIAGCGEVAQTTHLPTFALLSHLYEVTALCDVSPGFLDHCATKFGIEKKYSDFSDLAKDPEIDLVFILTADEYHASMAVEAADNGKAVFIEKPMALTHADAKAIVEAEKRNGVVVFVGYMRRYAAAYERMKEEIANIKNIRYATVRDIIGLNSFFVGQSGTFPAAFTDFPPEANADRQARGKAMVETALSPEGAANPKDVFTYRLLGGLGSHDLSAMRELLGVPNRCFAASRAQGEGMPFITALFDYGGFTATYESGIDNVADFDAHIEVIGDGKRVKISYDTPYVKGLPITIQVKEQDSHGHYVERTIRPTYKDAYTIELESLHASLTEGKPVKTSPSDAAQDLIIFDQIMGALVN
ncbi:Gfo/Idh/MocA family oxidoreductase [Rhodotorula paludigena]|uniref:Gfo/Idh/MocA family oxidoreductase n=1 Tax=Rhodotorula paludigena TaxID=86838 RepID=UPI00317424D3